MDEPDLKIGSFEASDRKLHHAMSLQQLLFLSMGGIIGSGWLFAVLGADATAGPAAVVSWILGGIFVLLIALAYAEVAGMLPRSGAIIRYPALTHGAFVGFILGGPTPWPPSRSRRSRPRRSSRTWARSSPARTSPRP